MIYPKSDKVGPGDKIVVTPIRIEGNVSSEVMHSLPRYTMKVERMTRNTSTGVVTMYLDGEQGKCRVFEHDEGKTWYRHSQLN